MRLFNLVLEGSFLALLQFLGVPRGSFLGSFSRKVPLYASFLEKVGPSFLHTFTTFWFDVEGLGHPQGADKQEKNSFQIIIVVLGVILGRLLMDFWKVFAAFLWRSLEPLQDRIWLHFGIIVERF